MDSESPSVDESAVKVSVRTADATRRSHARRTRPRWDPTEESPTWAAASAAADTAAAAAAMLDCLPPCFRRGVLIRKLTEAALDANASAEILAVLSDGQLTALWRSVEAEGAADPSPLGGAGANCVAAPARDSLALRLSSGGGRGGEDEEDPAAAAAILSCRAFRWPEVRRIQELKRLAVCAFAAAGRECVNPYHWGRLATAIAPGNLLPCQFITLSINGCFALLLSPSFLCILMMVIFVDIFTH